MRQEPARRSSSQATHSKLITSSLSQDIELAVVIESMPGRDWNLDLSGTTKDQEAVLQA
jgi:hypothetical protein